VTAEYLSGALGATSGGARLEIESVAAIGTGQMAESYRVVFKENAARQIPKSVVVKVPSQNESSRAASSLNLASSTPKAIEIVLKQNYYKKYRDESL
jgi:hypothetical protein